ncbi:hypothetical protein CK203_114294 [Vitis vinifera]|uniref:Uncharacterized protein n=1 Tax=Vitis vinifera TaxID=29760 RepID=A0A438C480_VITVI|nr:hypothetical protein CK203_114294 [Vitis vinifera]
MGKGKKMGEESPEPAMGVGVGKRERGMSGHYHGSVFTSLISLSSLRLSLACYRNFVPKKKIWESPTEPACSSNYRSSPPPQTTGPSISTTPFTKVRSNLLPPIPDPSSWSSFPLPPPSKNASPRTTSSWPTALA